MVRVLKNKWFWAAAFSLLFVLSIDLWAWDWSFPTAVRSAVHHHLDSRARGGAVRRCSCCSRGTTGPRTGVSRDGRARDLASSSSTSSSLLASRFYAYRRSKRTSEDYFVASRSIGPVVLFLSHGGHQLQRVHVLRVRRGGVQVRPRVLRHHGLRDGLHGPLVLLHREEGLEAREEARATSRRPELIGDRFKSDSLRMIFLAVMVVFTLPYLATQAIGGRHSARRSSRTGRCRTRSGAVIVTLVVIAYVTIGGMRADAYTDVLQGIMMLVTLLAAVGIVSRTGSGGFTEANSRLAEEFPDLLSRPGGQGLLHAADLVQLHAPLDTVRPDVPAALHQVLRREGREGSIKFSMMMYAPSHRRHLPVPRAHRGLGQPAVPRTDRHAAGPDPADDGRASSRRRGSSGSCSPVRSPRSCPLRTRSSSC